MPRASAVLIVGAQVAPDEDGEGGYKSFHAEYDTGQAAAHVTLQARAMGLHAHQFAGFDKAAVADESGAGPLQADGRHRGRRTRHPRRRSSERDREREHRVRRRRPLAAGPWPAVGRAVGGPAPATPP